MVLYGLLVAAWGIAIFILIVRWWNPPHRRVWIERIDKILCVLFNLTGFLLAPSRTRDSYRMFRITMLRRRALRRRKRLGLPPLADDNDLPRSYTYRLYDTNRRRHLAPAEAAEAARDEVEKHKGSMLTPGQRRLRKKQAQDAAGVRDRVHHRTAAQAEMRVVEEAAAVAVAVARATSPPAPTPVPPGAGSNSLQPSNRQHHQRHSSMNSLGSHTSGMTQAYDLANPPAHRPNIVARMVQATGEVLGFRKRPQAKPAASGPSIPSASPTPTPLQASQRVPQGDRPVTLTFSGWQDKAQNTPAGEADPEASGDVSQYPPSPSTQIRPPSTSKHARPTTPGSRPSLEVNTRIVHPHPHYPADYHAPPGQSPQLHRPPSTAPLLIGPLSSHASSPEGSQIPSAGTPSLSIKSSARPYILVRSRSEYRAPKIAPGTEARYSVAAPSGQDASGKDHLGFSAADAHGEDGSATRLATVVPFHSATPLGTHLTSDALASGAAVLIEGQDGRVAYAVPGDAEPEVLSLAEESQLVYQQRRFRSSHPYYRYHETETHRAFSSKLAIAIVILSDMHSCLQFCLCGVTWGIEYHHRPTALTAAIISCSLSCNALAGLLIWIGGRKTKKKEVMHAQLMRGLEAEARLHVRRARALEARAAALAAQGKDPYPFQARGPAALIKLNLYDLDGRHELPQIHGPFPGPRQPPGRDFWTRLWGKPSSASPPRIRSPPSASAPASAPASAFASGYASPSPPTPRPLAGSGHDSSRRDEPARLGGLFPGMQTPTHSPHSPPLGGVLTTGSTLSTQPTPSNPSLVHPIAVRMDAERDTGAPSTSPLYNFDLGPALPSPAYTSPSHSPSPLQNKDPDKAPTGTRASMMMSGDSVVYSPAGIHDSTLNFNAPPSEPVRNTQPPPPASSLPLPQGQGGTAATAPVPGQDHHPQTTSVRLSGLP